MIQRLEATKSYNPVRSHIEINFTEVKDATEKIEVIAEDLANSKFDDSVSRVLIFSSMRSRAEMAAAQLSEALKNHQVSYWDKVDYYHAGLESSEREIRYENFKQGEISIIVATKAFGMGLDIPNIHYLYHLEPSSNFEDFLQEVGRAGRNKKAYKNAGFSKSRPIKTNCIIAKDDYKKAKDRLHKHQITWDHIVEVQRTVNKYVRQFSKRKLNTDRAFALPLDLLNQYSNNDERESDETFFRVVLYWLERLKKIKLGTYTPTHIPLTINQAGQNYSVVKDADDVVKIKNLCSLLVAQNKGQSDDDVYYMAEFDDLKKFLQIDKVSDAWRLLFLGQKAKALRIERNFLIEPTKTRRNELEAWNSNSMLPSIETVFSFTNQLLFNSKFNQQTHFDGEEVDQLAQDPIDDNLVPNKIFWKEYYQKSKQERNKENIAERLRSDFKNKRAKVSFKLIDFLPNATHRSIIQMEKGYSKPLVTQLIFNGYHDKKGWETYLECFKSDLYALIWFVYDQYMKSDVKKFNIVDILINLNIESKGEEYFRELIFIAKGLGYLKGSACGLVPMGIELFTLDQNLVINEKLDEYENSIKEEFEESVRMKELRLMTLECLSTSVPIKKYDKFIKGYFKCASLTDIVKLLEEHLGEHNEILAAFRSEALKKAINNLKGGQEKVYNASVRENIQVIAGPGSGKTHTLILRVARLIQDEKINPENILVLAYNRAVVVELKNRLSKLFQELGYGNLIKKLKVFTFHGFCKYTLGSELDGTNLDDWTGIFLNIAKKQPGKISQRLGLIKHVLVDEFQDITKQRLELLKFIANPQKTKVCVIGDPNQSIYGYERVKEGGVMSPQPYYKAFDEMYKPKLYELNINYRSYSQILVEADKLLSLNQSKIEIPTMVADNKYQGENPVCELYNYDIDKTNWKNELLTLVNHVRENGEHYKYIAVMFRSNREVYKAFNELRETNLDDTRIRIQGAEGNLASTREFHYFLRKIKIKFDENLPVEYLSTFKATKEPLLKKFPNWDEHLINIFLCIAFEFKKEYEEDSTYGDLYDFIKDISHNDDGQYGKIYQQNIFQITRHDAQREIVLTTMHKVKGMEYDAVLIPPSFSNLPLKSDDSKQNLQDVIEEERRLYYVAYTRAKYKLVVIKWRRENALYQRTPKKCEILTKEQIEKRLGILFNEGIDKFKLYWGASRYGRTSFEIIKNNIRIGDEVILRKRKANDYEFWDVIVANQTIAQLSSNIPNRLKGLNEIEGFLVSSVYAHTYEQTINSETGAQYAINWTEEAKKRGYIYLIDFSGYGKIIN